MTNNPKLYGELMLRRYRAGELSPAERAELEAAAARDADLRLRLRALADEQLDFEAAMPFERFVGGVNRAQRERARSTRSSLPKAQFWAASGAAMALAAAALVLFIFPGSAQRTGNRTKGGADTFTSYVRVASGNGEQRAAWPRKLTTLQKGDRLRVGVQVKAGVAYFAAVSIEPTGASTALYAEGQAAMKIVATKEPMYMPDSVEFTGSGDETLFILSATQPFDVGTATAALKTKDLAATRSSFELDTEPKVMVTPYPLRKP